MKDFMQKQMKIIISFYIQRFMCELVVPLLLADVIKTLGLYYCFIPIVITSLIASIKMYAIAS